MKIKNILLYIAGILCIVIGVLWLCLFIMFWFSPESKTLETDGSISENAGFLVFITLSTTLGAIFILGGWLILRFMKKRKARLTQSASIESY